MTKDKITKYIQWMIIGLLTIVCFCLITKQKGITNSDNYNKNDTQFVINSEDKSLSELKKINKELHDSIKSLSNVKEAIQVKYIVKYKTDTIRLNDKYLQKDSVYHYSQESDTIDYDLSIKGKDVEWFKLNMAIKDSLMIVTRSNNGYNETTINHNPNTTITDVTVFTPKKSFIDKVKEKTYFGIGIGAGYGIINNKPDIYIGINVGIKF